MVAPLDVTGERYGRLTAVARVRQRPGVRGALWRFRCDCGRVVDLLLSNVRSGNTRSCGCLHREKVAERQRRHGHGGKPPGGGAYRSWQSMKDRCHNPNHPKWEYWGGRGISVCPEWRESFESFLAHMGPRPPGTTLDRIDNDKGYQPGNCRWATPDEQSANRRPRRWKVRPRPPGA